MPPFLRRHGFTLLEMSMVLTIIALLVGGMLATKNFLRNARIRSVISDVTRYKQAIADFRDKYQALPGDFAGATALWGNSGSTRTGCSGSATSPLPTTATCNGNGNGQVDWGPLASPGSTDTAANNYELFLLWQHLLNAQLIDGNYTGVTGSGSGRNAIAGTNVPLSQINGVGYSFYNMGNYSDSNTWSALYNHVLVLGASNGYETLQPALTSVEALAVDTKFDDGLPGSGKVMTYTATASANCVTSNTQSTARYSLTSSNLTCALIFITGF